MSNWFEKIKKTVKSATEIIETTQNKISGKIFKVSGTKYKTKKLLAEGMIILN